MKETTSTSADYPEYIIRASEIAFNPPYDFQNTQFYGFVLEGTPEALQRLCDKYLNIRGQDVFYYRPTSHYVLMVFDKIAKIHSTEPEGQDKGFFFEDGEAMFWVLTEAINQDGECDHRALFIPYIFVDSAPALILGREVYGFPKALANFKIPEDPNNPQKFSLKTLVLKTFDATSKTVWEEIVKIQSNRVTEEKFDMGNKENQEQKINCEQEKETSASLKTAFEEFGNVLKAFNIDKEAFPDLLKSLQLPVVFLKQFRSEQDGNLACYQAIVKAAFTFKRFRFNISNPIPFKLYKRKFQVTIADYASCPLAEELGLQRTQIAKFAFWVHFDFAFGNGKEIWSATP